MINVKEVFRLGRKYPFPRPQSCLRRECRSTRIWGHGFVLRYFDECPGYVELRRWRCADCGCVYLIRPFGYWPRHHVPIRTVLKSLCHRLLCGFWDKTLGLSRQRQRHWLMALRKNILTYLGLDFAAEVMLGFHMLVPVLMVPVIRSF